MKILLLSLSILIFPPSIFASSVLPSLNLCQDEAISGALKQKIATSFNTFTGSNTEVLEQFYSPSINYQDPISSIQGLENVKKLLTRTYKNVQSLRYSFFDFICESNKISASYELTIQIVSLNGNKPYLVKGTSVFHFDENGLVTKHRDYFDLGSMVYEKHPLTGSTIRAIKAALAK